MHLYSYTGRQVQAEALLFLREGVFLIGACVFLVEHDESSGSQVDERGEPPVQKEIVSAEEDGEGRELVFPVVVVSYSGTQAELLTLESFVQVVNGDTSGARFTQAFRGGHVDDVQTASWRVERGLSQGRCCPAEEDGQE